MTTIEAPEGARAISDAGSALRTARTRAGSAAGKIPSRSSIQVRSKGRGASASMRARPTCPAPNSQTGCRRSRKRSTTRSPSISTAGPSGATVSSIVRARTRAPSRPRVPNGPAASRAARARTSSSRSRPNTSFSTRTLPPQHWPRSGPSAKRLKVAAGASPRESASRAAPMARHSSSPPPTVPPEPAVGSDHHARARLARRGPAHRRDGDERARPVRGEHLGDRRPHPHRLRIRSPIRPALRRPRAGSPPGSPAHRGAAPGPARGSRARR